MGCFFACFGSSKDAKRVKHRHKTHFTDQESTFQRTFTPKSVRSSFYSLQDDCDTTKPLPLHPALEAGNAHEMFEKMTFDSIVQTAEHVPLSQEESDSILEKQLHRKEEEDNSIKASKHESSSEDSAIPSTMGSYPLSHRYSNCRDSDDEDEVLDITPSHLANHEDEKVGYNDLIKDDEFGMVDSRREISAVAVFTEEGAGSSTSVSVSVSVSRLPEKELYQSGSIRNVRDRTAYICPVLNPVENLHQWNAVKLKGTCPPAPQKENLQLEQTSPSPLLSISESTTGGFLFSSESKTDKLNKLNQELAVDASLSNWLVSSETTPIRKTHTATAVDIFTSAKRTRQGSKSPRSHEDKPILGALTVEELRQFSSSTSPRKSPNRNPDEMPIIGTVGTYWSHTVMDRDPNSASSFKGMPNTTSKYREDKIVNWHSTPFETRLERVLNKGVAKT